MQVQRGFTIIEFTIAIAIAAILGAAAIARYNTYLREQEFLGGGQVIANCLQHANTLSRAGGNDGTPPRFVRATIAYDSSVPKVSCIVEPEPQFASDGSRLTVTQLLQGTPAASTTNQLYTAVNARLSSGTTVRVVFGALESGAPLGYSLDAVLLRQPDDPLTPSTYVPFGSGFTMDAATNTVRLNSDASAKCGVIQMTALGTSTRFAELDTCS